MMIFPAHRVSEPAPYESHDEYLWFIEQMRKELEQEDRNV
jgi:hypothetical protein